MPFADRIVGDVQPVAAQDNRDDLRHADARTSARHGPMAEGMVMARPIDPQSYLQLIHDTGPRLANAKASRVYLEEYRKSLKAILMKSSKENSAAAQERDAYADKAYIDHLEALKTAVHGEEALRWKMVEAQAAIEVWRSQESSARMMDKSAA